MDIETKMALAREVGEEIITEDELRSLFETKTHPIAYDGFEPSGKMHIAQGILRAINVNRMTKSGVRFKILVADWFAWMNNKMGGDLEKIRTTGDYFIEMWKVLGMDLKNVEFIWSKDLVRQEGHWKTTIDIARVSTVTRMLRCSQIMGRHETETLSAAQIIYPCMQAADIFHLKADICQLGMDQRKVNILAREVGPKLGFWKPVCVHHHMLLGLPPPRTSASDPSERILDLKMSKSKPDSAIFMTDSTEDIKRKISKAYCPERELKENPIMEYAQYLIFPKYDSFKIERPAKFGGDLEIMNFDELSALYCKGKIHPMDLKQSVSRYIDAMIEPVRTHFEKNKKARSLLEQVQSYQTTR
ncbi:MAG: tyrosine--tRNA ligase [archaeon]